MRHSALIAAIIAAGLAIPTPVLAEGTVSGSGEFGTGTTSTTGSVTVTYDTSAGQWTDPNGGTHAAGTYIVIIPTAVSWTGMNIGTVSASTSYDVRVCGVVSKAINVTATPSPWRYRRAKQPGALMMRMAALPTERFPAPAQRIRLRFPARLSTWAHTPVPSRTPRRWRSNYAVCAYSVSRR